MDQNEALMKCGVINGAVLMLSEREIQTDADTPGLRPEYREHILSLKRHRQALQSAIADAWPAGK